MRNESINPRNLSGVYVALITPMKKSEQGIYLNTIDYAKTEMLVDDLIRAKVAGIVPCGTTGQSSTLSEMLHLHFVATVLDMIDGRTETIPGVGSNNLEEGIKRMRAMEKWFGRPFTFLAETGYKNNPSQRGLHDFYTELIGHSFYGDSNLIMYNVPGRTGSNIEADTIIELAKNKKIIGLKEASGNYTHKTDGDMASKVKKIAGATNPDNFRVLSGEDDLIVKVIQLGGYGTISATANAAPLYLKNMIDEAMRAREEGGDYKAAEDMQKHIDEFVSAVFLMKNPIPLAMMFGTELKLPMTRHEEIKDKLYEIMSKYEPKALGIDFSKYNKEYGRYLQEWARTLLH